LNTRVHRYRGERAEGERAEAEMDAHIRRASKQRQKELGEDPNRARANAEWQALERAERRRAAALEEAHNYQHITFLRHLQRVYAKRAEEYANPLS